MNEQQRAEAFSHELDKLLAGHKPPTTDDKPADVQEALDFSEWMASVDMTAGTQHDRQHIYATLLGESQMTQVFQKNKWAVAAAVAVVLIGLLLLTPLPGYAANLLRQIGGISLSDEPTLVEQLEANQQPDTSGPTDQSIPTAMPPSQLSVGEAEDLAGFTIAEVTVPDGFTQVGREVYPGAGEGITVMTRYANGATFLTFSQEKLDESLPAPYGQWNIGDAEVTDTTVNGAEAVYVEDAQIIAIPSDAPGEFTSAGANILIWEDGDHTYTLVTNSLVMDDLIAIAESMTK